MAAVEVDPLRPHIFEAEEMLDWEKWMDIGVLHKSGESIREIARQTGHSRNTVRRVLRSPVTGARPERHRSRRERKTTPYEAYLQERFETTGLSGVRLFEEIQAQGYGGSLDGVQRFLATLRPAQARQKRLTVRFETPAGGQAQCDWADCGTFEHAGERTTIYAFVFVLGFSRLRYVEFTTSQSLEVLLGCLERAFAFCGGVPHQILFDNMKQIRLGPGQLNPLALEFAAHWGFGISTHRPYRPRTKGKVERLVEYLKDHFLRGRSFCGLDDLCTQGRAWCDRVNGQAHGTTGVAPRTLWENVERAALSPLVKRPFALLRRVGRRVGFEALVRFEASCYSVPPSYAGRRVHVEKIALEDARGQEVVAIRIRCEETIIATHTPATAKGQSVIDEEHRRALWEASTPCGTPIPQLAAPPIPAWEMRFGVLEHQVQRVALDFYERLASSEATDTEGTRARATRAGGER